MLMAWSSSLLPGFAFPCCNNVFSLPIVLDYAASAEGPHDAFTRSLENFVSGFWILLGLFANERNVFWVYFGAHILARLMFMAGIYGLVRQLGASQKSSLALTGLAGIAPLFKGLSPVGHTETLATYLTHTEFAIAMLPGCWWLLVRGRWVSGAFAIGLVFNVNAFLSIWSAVAAVIALVAVSGFSRRLLWCGAAYLVAALPTLIWILSTLSQPAQPIDFREYLMEYYPLHTFVHVQWDAVARYAAFLAAAAIAVKCALTELSGPVPRIMLALAIGYVAIFLLGVPLPYVTGSSLVLNLYPLRIDAVINVAVAIILLGWAGKSLWTGDDRLAMLPLAIALALLSGNMVALLLLTHTWTVAAGRRFDSRIAAVVLCATVVLLMIFPTVPVIGGEFVPVTILFCGLTLFAAAAARGVGSDAATLSALTLALVCGFLPESEAFPWPQVGLALVVALRLSRVGWLPPIAFACAGLTSLWIADFGTLMSAVGALAVSAAGVALALFGRFGWRGIADKAISPAALFGGFAALGLGLTAMAGWRGSFERPDVSLSPERESQQWARNNIPPHTELLEVGFSGFGVLSRRPIWVDEQAGAAVMWKPEYLVEWRSRMARMKACADAKCLTQLARRNNIGWIVTARGRVPGASRAGLRLRFINEKYEIYSLMKG